MSGWDGDNRVAGFREFWGYSRKMTIHRSAGLQRLLDAMRDAIAARESFPGSAKALADRSFEALRQVAPESAEVRASRLPACDLLVEALAAARAGPPSIARVADAFAEIEATLPWKRRANAEMSGRRFADNHAYAEILGPFGGLEPRGDVRIGVSLMAPRLQYPDHHHPPEEIYLALSKGEWRQEEGPWYEPGMGGLVFNPSNVVHAMRSADTPLLALWCLWTADRPFV
jgi:quercetin dioxygenase-like cupin family protein